MARCRRGDEIFIGKLKTADDVSAYSGRRKCRMVVSVLNNTVYISNQVLEDKKWESDSEAFIMNEIEIDFVIESLQKIKKIKTMM